MKTKRIFKKRPRPLRKQKSLKRKHRTRRLGGAIARLSRAAQGVGTAAAAGVRLATRSMRVLPQVSAALLVRHMGTQSSKFGASSSHRAGHS